MLENDKPKEMMTFTNDNKREIKSKKSNSKNLIDGEPINNIIIKLHKSKKHKMEFEESENEKRIVKNAREMSVKDSLAYHLNESITHIEKSKKENGNQNEINQIDINSVSNSVDIQKTPPYNELICEPSTSDLRNYEESDAKKKKNRGDTEEIASLLLEGALKNASNKKVKNEIKSKSIDTCEEHAKHILTLPKNNLYEETNTSKVETKIEIDIDKSTDSILQNFLELNDINVRQSKKRKSKENLEILENDEPNERMRLRSGSKHEMQSKTSKRMSLNQRINSLLEVPLYETNEKTARDELIDKLLQET